MNQPYDIENLENQGKLIGDIDEPYFFKITAGQRFFFVTARIFFMRFLYANNREILKILMLFSVFSQHLYFVKYNV